MSRITVAQDVRVLRLAGYPDRDDQLDALWKAIGALADAVEMLGADAKPATLAKLRARLAEPAAAEGLTMAADVRAVKAKFPKLKG